MSFTSTPKTLAERLQWMADNLPGFREELEAVEEAKRRIASKSRVAAPARSEARTAAASGFLVAFAPCAFCQAGEVSPPDSPTYGNPSVFHPVQS